MTKAAKPLQESLNMDKNRINNQDHRPIDYLLYSLVFGVFAAIGFTFILWLEF